MQNLISSLQAIASESLAPIVDFFNSLNTPEPIVHWGHPLMMAIVIFVMGTFTAAVGWQGRTATDSDIRVKKFADHKKLAPFLTTFLVLGYSGGILSLLMQGQSIFESAHFWLGTVVLALLGLNGMISLSKFGGGKPQLRTVHAYLGSVALILLFVHAALGLKLGLSI